MYNHNPTLCCTQVAPAELEDLLLKHPNVADAGVTGLPDRLCGEVPHAWVVPRAGSGLSEGKLHAYINGEYRS